MERLRAPEVLTPEQVAEYLQLRTETVYRYIKDGRLAASRLGRTYRIPRQNVDLFLLANSTKADVRDALFARVMDIAKGGADVPADEVEQDVAEAVAHARRVRRA